MKKNKPRFVVDAMLGNLARKFRLFGYDSIYSSKISDEELLSIAKNEKRILITKDEQLAKSCLKNFIDTITITKDDELEQFIQICRNIDLEKFIVGGKISRCSLCNSKLERTNRKNVLDKIPKGVIEKNNEFWKCGKCEKLYWEGTHIKNLQHFVTKLNTRVKIFQ